MWEYAVSLYDLQSAEKADRATTTTESARFFIPIGSGELLELGGLIGGR